MILRGATFYAMTEETISQGHRDAVPGAESSSSKLPGRFLVPVYALGLMVSPDNLALLGSFAGHVSIYAPLLIVVGALVYLGHTGSYLDLYRLSAGPAGEVPDMRRAMGSWLAYYPLVVRILAAMLLTTGLMVSSGFVFNEVFVYWFPNFGIAFILLVVLSVLHLLSSGIRKGAQVVFVVVALLGPVLLIGASLWKGLPHAAAQIPSGPLNAMPWMFVPLIFFIGFDMADSVSDVSLHRSRTSLTWLKIAIAIFGGFAILWVVILRQHVGDVRLMATSISHIIAAREICGQVGRVVMGLVVIAGSCAAVNALFESVGRLAAAMRRHRMLPRIPHTPQVAILSVAAAAAVMMAGGLAGMEQLETLIRATLLLWLAGYGLIPVRLLQLMRSGNGVVPPTRQKTNRVGLLITAMLTFGGVGILAVTDASAILVALIMTSAILGVLVCGALNKWLTQPSPNNIKYKGGSHAE
jgi:amino acid transporter